MEDKTNLMLACEALGLSYNLVLFSQEPIPSLVYAVAELLSRIEKLEEVRSDGDEQ